MENHYKIQLQEEAALKRFIDPSGMNIKALGARTLTKLYHRGLLTKPKDIFNLDVNYILSRRIMTPLQLDKTWNAIAMMPSIKLPNVLYALNIPNLGLDYAKIISLHCKTLRGFMHDSDILYQIEELPNHVKDSVAEWMGEMENHEFMALLVSRNIGMLPYEDPTKSLPLSGQIWYFSVFDVRTLGLRKKIQNLGGRCVDTLSKRCLYAVFHRKPNINQIKPCEDYGITILTLAEAQDKVERRQRKVDDEITDPFERAARGL